MRLGVEAHPNSILKGNHTDGHTQGGCGELADWWLNSDMVLDCPAMGASAETKPLSRGVRSSGPWRTPVDIDDLVVDDGDPGRDV